MTKLTREWLEQKKQERLKLAQELMIREKILGLCKYCEKAQYPNCHGSHTTEISLSNGKFLSEYIARIIDIPKKTHECILVSRALTRIEVVKTRPGPQKVVYCHDGVDHVLMLNPLPWIKLLDAKYQSHVVPWEQTELEKEALEWEIEPHGE